jgi:hypothetical protein
MVCCEAEGVIGEGIVWKVFVVEGGLGEEASCSDGVERCEKDVVKSVPLEGRWDVTLAGAALAGVG